MSTTDENNDAGSDSDFRSTERRFQCTVKQWRDYTAAERAIASSLDDEQAEDLSIHLYNAHAIKARHYDLKAARTAKPWQSKDAWYGENVDAWRPPAHWTAWPLSSSEVPRLGESLRNPSFALSDPDGTVRKPEAWRCSNELEQQLLAIMLRCAKVQLGTYTPHQVNDIHASDPQTQDDQPADEAAEDDPESTNGEATYTHSPPAQQAPCDARSSTISPRLMSDDDDARALLLPGIRHTISQLDDLLTALHRSRKGHIKSHNTPKHYHTHSLSAQSASRSGSEVSESSSEATDETALSSISDGLRPRRARSRIKPLRPRDWSEVLGIAAMTGWDVDVVQSAVTRCRSLFEEDMVLSNLPDASVQEINVKPAKQQQGKQPRATKHLFCPVEDCSYYDKLFDSVKRLHEHLRRKHSWTSDMCKQRSNADKLRSSPQTEKHGGNNVHDDSMAITGLDYAALKRRKII